MFRPLIKFIKSSELSKKPRCLKFKNVPCNVNHGCVLGGTLFFYKMLPTDFILGPVYVEK